MNIRFRENMKVEAVFNGDSFEKILRFGEIHNVISIIECLENPDYVDITFNSGDIVYGLHKSTFTLMGNAKITRENLPILTEKDIIDES